MLINLNSSQVSRRIRNGPYIRNVSRSEWIHLRDRGLVSKEPSIRSEVSAIHIDWSPTADTDPALHRLALHIYGLCSDSGHDQILQCRYRIGYRIVDPRESSLPAARVKVPQMVRRVNAIGSVLATRIGRHASGNAADARHVRIALGVAGVDADAKLLSKLYVASVCGKGDAVSASALVDAYNQRAEVGSGVGCHTELPRTAAVRYADVLRSSKALGGSICAETESSSDVEVLFNSDQRDYSLSYRCGSDWAMRRHIVYNMYLIGGVGDAL